MEEIVIADYVRDRVHIYDYHGDKDSVPTISRWDVEDIELVDDWLYVADVMKGGEDEVLVAHGMGTGDWHKGAIDILHTPGDWVGYDSRFALDELINEHGDWAERLAPGWCENGYLLIVGESSIIPAFTSMYSDDSTWWASLTDTYYASTEGTNPDVPEIAVGRIIGDNPVKMREAIETCISMAQGDFALDNSDAYLLAGSGCEGWFETHTREINGDILIPQGFSTVFEKSFGPAAITATDFFDHTPDNDIIHIYGHGGATVAAGILNTTNVTNNFDPCSTRPLVCAFWSCDTGRYSQGKSLAESFIEKGASAYIGATSRSDGSGANGIAREFYSNLGPSVTIGRAHRDAKYQVVNDSTIDSVVRKYNCAVNHLYGDPKMTMSGWGGGVVMASPEIKESSESQPPPSNIQINIPDYEVTDIGDKDHVTIPGGGELIVTGKPIVPIYSYSVSLPPSYQVQNVSLTQTGGLTEDMGLNIPESDGNYPVSEPNYDGLSVQGEGWWPLE
ncbi:MAG: C25 family cysteine peptidase, partial [Candidatus Zixiibacteriota bacterium]